MKHRRTLHPKNQQAASASAAIPCSPCPGWGGAEANQPHDTYLPQAAGHPKPNAHRHSCSEERRRWTTESSALLSFGPRDRSHYNNHPPGVSTLYTGTRTPGYGNSCRVTRDGLSCCSRFEEVVTTEPLKFVSRTALWLYARTASGAANEMGEAVLIVRSPCLGRDGRVRRQNIGSIEFRNDFLAPRAQPTPARSINDNTDAERRSPRRQTHTAGTDTIAAAGDITTRHPCSHIRRRSRTSC